MTRRNWSISNRLYFVPGFIPSPCLSLESGVALLLQTCMTWTDGCNKIEAGNKGWIACKSSVATHKRVVVLYLLYAEYIPWCLCLLGVTSFSTQLIQRCLQYRNTSTALVIQRPRCSTWISTHEILLDIFLPYSEHLSMLSSLGFRQWQTLSRCFSLRWNLPWCPKKFGWHSILF